MPYINTSKVEEKFSEVGRLKAAIELLQFKIDTAQGSAVPTSPLNEVLLVAGASFTKEIEVI